MRPITKSVIRKLLRMKWRALAISLVVAFAMGMIVSGFYGSSVMDSSVDSFFESSAMPDVFMELANPVNASELEAPLASTPGIKAQDLRRKVSGTYTFEAEDIEALVIGMGDPLAQRLNKLHLVEGRFFSSPWEAVAIAGMEDEDVKVGAGVTIRIGNESTELNITGTVRSPEYIFPSAYGELSLPTQGTLVVIYMDLEELEDLVGPGVNDVVVLLEPGSDEKAVVRSLEPFGLESVTYQASHPSVMFMEVGSNKIKNMFPVLGAIFLFVGFISVFMTMMRLVQTDSRYIGVLMSLGYRRAEIVRSYIAFGLIITVIGATLGALIGYAFTYGMVDASLKIYMNIEIVFPVDILPFVLGSLFVAAVVLVSVIIPVHLITRASVREALEYRPRSAVRTSRALSGSLSRLTRMGLRNTTRNPWRLAITVLVVGVTIGTAGMWSIMADSAFSYMNDQIEADTWDLRVSFDPPLATSSANGSFLGLEPGEVGYLVPFTKLQAVVGKGSDEEGAVVMGCDEMALTREFKTREGKMDFSRAVISSKLADETGAGPGDRIVISFSDQRVTLEVSGVAQEGLAKTVYTHRSTLAALYDYTNCSGVYVQLTEPGQSRDIARDIRGTPGVAAVLVHDKISENFEEMLTMAQGFFYFFFLISILITLAVAGSAVIISAMERDVEFATLDTLGFSKGRVAKVILVEMAVLGLLASLIGVPMAYLMASMMAGIFADIIFYFPVIWVLGATILTFVMGMVFVLLSSIMPIRYANKLDTDRTIRERTAG